MAMQRCILGKSTMTWRDRYVSGRIKHRNPSIVGGSDQLLVALDRPCPWDFSRTVLCYCGGGAKWRREQRTM